MQPNRLVVCMTALIIVMATGPPAWGLSVSVPYINANDVHAKGITGTGEVIGMLDLSAADKSHPNLPNVVLAVDFSGAGLTISNHATMTAGILGGTLPGNGGVAPGAKVYSVDYGAGPYSEKVRSNAIMDAMHSLGQGPGVNATIWNMSAQLPGVDADGQNQLAKFLDYFTREHDTVFVKSAGNEVNITAPGGAFNIITAGGTGHGFDPNVVDYSKVAKEPQSGFDSGEGKLNDGRSKPDIVAPGQQITAPRAYWSDSDNANGDLEDDDSDGRIGLEIISFHSLVQQGVIFRDAPTGNDVKRMSINDADGNGRFTISKDLIIGTNIVDTDGDGKLSSGDVIYSALAFDAGDDPDPDSRTGNGTSFAAPHVAGTAALLRDFADNTAKKDDHRVIKAILLNASDKDGFEKTKEKEAKDKYSTLWEPLNPGTDPLDVQMGAGQLNALACITQYTPAEALAGFKGSGQIEVDPLSWDFNRIDANAIVDYKIKLQLLEDTKLTATLAWDRIIDWTDDGAVAGKPDFDDKFDVLRMCNLDMILLDALGNEMYVFDWSGRASYSKSPVDSVEHIYYTIPKTDFYSVRVKNLSNHKETFGWALWSHPVPEPATMLGVLLGVGGLAGYIRRRLAA